MYLFYFLIGNIIVNKRTRPRFGRSADPRLHLLIEDDTTSGEVFKIIYRNASRDLARWVARAFFLNISRPSSHSYPATGSGRLWVSAAY